MGLLPRRQIDIKAVFHGDATKATRDRAAAFLKSMFDKFSDRTREDLDRPNVITEELFIAMPTLEARNSEFRLCEAIARHSAGTIDDAVIKTVLADYLAAHTFIYEGLERRVKQGDLDHWWTGKMFYVKAGKEAFTCSEIQRYLIEMIKGPIEVINL